MAKTMNRSYAIRCPVPMTLDYCISCGTQYAWESVLQYCRKKDGELFFCPVGCAASYKREAAANARFPDTDDDSEYTVFPVEPLLLLPCVSICGTIFGVRLSLVLTLSIRDELICPNGHSLSRAQLSEALAFIDQDRQPEFWRNTIRVLEHSKGESV